MRLLGRKLRQVLTVTALPRSGAAVGQTLSGLQNPAADIIREPLACYPLQLLMPAEAQKAALGLVTDSDLGAKMLET